MSSSQYIFPPGPGKPFDPKGPFCPGALSEIQAQAEKYIEMSKKCKGQLFPRRALLHMESVINYVCDFTGGPRVTLVPVTPSPVPAANAKTSASDTTAPKPKRKQAVPPPVNPETIASRTRGSIRRGEANVAAKESTTATATTSKSERPVSTKTSTTTSEKIVASEKTTLNSNAGLDAIALPTRSSSRLKASGKATTAETNTTAAGKKPPTKLEVTPGHLSQSSVPQMNDAAGKKQKRAGTEASAHEHNNKKAKQTNVPASEQQSIQQSRINLTRSVAEQTNVAAPAQQQPLQQARLKVTRSVAKTGAPVKNESLASTSNETGPAAVAGHKRRRGNNDGTSAQAGSSKKIKQEQNDATSELLPRKKIRIIFKPRNCTPEELARARKIMNGELPQFAPMPKKAKITIVGRAPEDNGNAIQDPIQPTDTADANSQSKGSASKETVQQAPRLVSAHVTHVFTSEPQGQVSRRLMLTVRGLNTTKE
ncbi:hypothetical protein V8F33_005879 [Rhypophila sp. PSN 637]